MKTIEHVMTTSIDAVRGFGEADVAQLAHDLKTPLATIALESQLLELGIDDLDQVTMCAAVRRILRNVAILDRMIQDILDLDAIEGGRFVLVRGRAELGMLICGVIDRVVATRESDRVAYEATGPLFVDIDELRIERVLAHLLENALDHWHAGIIHLTRTASHACVSIMATGPRGSASDLELIFDTHHRDPGASHGGAGLGLYVSKHIVEAHGGRIGIEVLTGRGARLFFELPLEQ